MSIFLKSISKQSKKMVSLQYIISVDFGTAKSGFAYIDLSKSDKKVHVNRVFKLGNNLEHAYKNDTCLLYKRGENGYSVVSWGMDARRQMQNYVAKASKDQSFKLQDYFLVSDFKLALKEGTLVFVEETSESIKQKETFNQAKERVRSASIKSPSKNVAFGVNILAQAQEKTSQQPKPEKKEFSVEDIVYKVNSFQLPLVQIIADYLTEMHKFISQRLDNPLKPGTVRWILTVPAIWEDRMKLIMRIAATRAGIIHENLKGDYFRFAFEPEAAAICLVTNTDQKKTLKPGQTFIVVDAGGGTIDITAYKVEGEYGNTTLTQLHAASGDAVGGTFVDRQLWNHLCGILKNAGYSHGSMENTFAKFKASKEFFFLQHEWEKKKVSYDPEDYSC
jgi:hypothetical protein